MMKMDFDKKYTGYYWLSDSQEPVVLENEPVEQALFAVGNNPFVIEAQLLSADESVAVRYCDGKCIEVITPCSEFADEQAQVYVSLRMGSRKLKFVQLWQEDDDADNLCCGMTSLVPGRMVFAGFA